MISPIRIHYTRTMFTDLFAWINLTALPRIYFNGAIY